MSHPISASYSCAKVGVHPVVLKSEYEFPVNDEIFSEDAIKGDFEMLHKYVKEMREATTVAAPEDGWIKLSEKHLATDSTVLFTPAPAPTKPDQIMFSNDVGRVIVNQRRHGVYKLRWPLLLPLLVCAAMVSVWLHLP